MNLKQYRERHPEHLGEAGGYCITCALIDALKEERNKVLDEVKRGLQAQGSIAINGGQFMYSKDNVDSLLDQLKLK